jgi:hypothetical protein
MPNFGLLFQQLHKIYMLKISYQFSSRAALGLALGFGGLATSGIATAAVTLILEQNTGSTSSSVTGLVSGSNFGTTGAAAINSASSVTSPSVLSPSTTDRAAATSSTGGPTVNTISSSNVGNGYAYSDSLGSKLVRYQATEAGTFYLNTNLAAGSVGTTAGPNGWGTSSAGLVWTISLGGLLEHSLGITTGVAQPAFGLLGVGSGVPLNTGGVVGTGSITNATNGTSSIYSWGAQSFTDSIQLAAGQFVDVYTTIGSNVRSNYFDDLTTLATCGSSGGFSNCGTSYVNFAASFETSFEPGMVAAVPEPGEWAMMLAGLGAVGVIARRRKVAASTLDA